MEGELKNFIMIWIITMLCLSYCHYIVSRLFPKGIVRLISLLPVFYLFITIPLNLHSFHVSGLMHEVIYYYVARVPPTWEVTWFFVLHGVCLVVEVELKKAVTGRWRLHPGVSRALTLVFLVVTAHWLFFPQLLRNGVDTKALAEYAMLGDFVKAKLPIKS
ncbi:hypothetical protein M0R45_005708 [Rubus argutus]|uniref:Acyltransferase 3 domain-containing protein n=1 Tax=Rubus argutus TaxID=59490 RepID=A0AAW1YNE9_RUBAR